MEHQVHRYDSLHNEVLLLRENATEIGIEKKNSVRCQIQDKKVNSCLFFNFNHKILVVSEFYKSEFLPMLKKRAGCCQ